MRDVSVYEWWRPDGSDYNVPFEKKLKTKGVFLGFGLDFDAIDNGVGTYSIAIVELENGDIINPPVELIKFEDG